MECFARAEVFSAVALQANTPGITGSYVLQQSSLTWPEFRKLVIDVTTCGIEVDVHQILPELKRVLAADEVLVSAEVI
ncbi:S-adenosylmethionine decarboxylase [Candidatus Electronema sp. PJ]|uniref:S-adenosylmethionine decarboxylase n=1 Tax=Candidatus Electronema sp. PJ TaxID=3401572 RepID=UPI003AA8A6F9